MSNPLTETSAPFVFTILIGIFGWMAESAFESSKDIRIVEFDREIINKDEVNLHKYKIINKSAINKLKDGIVRFECPEGISCFVNIPGINAPYAYYYGNNYNIQNSPEIDPDGKIVKIEALIAPKGEINIELGVSKEIDSVSITYVVDKESFSKDENMSAMFFYSSESSHIGYLDFLMIFVLSNNYAVIVFMFLIVVLYYGLRVFIYFLQNRKSDVICFRYHKGG